eukprot:3238655-Rhodomonas_salina.1
MRRSDSSVTAITALVKSSFSFTEIISLRAGSSLSRPDIAHSTVGHTHNNSVARHIRRIKLHSAPVQYKQRRDDGILLLIPHLMRAISLALSSLCSSLSFIFACPCAVSVPRIAALARTPEIKYIPSTICTRNAVSCIGFRGGGR